MKKLIYFTLGNNINYIKLSKLCIESLYKNGYDGDFLFITDLKDELLKDINFKKPPFFLDIESSNLLGSSANKLKIYKFADIQKYDKIIFSDLDILWLSNPNTIFDVINEDKFFMSNENALMSEEYWGGRLLTDTEKTNIMENKIKGVNAGIFAFNQNMVKHLKSVDLFLSENINLVNSCLEQPFLNVYLYRNGLYNTNLNNYVSHNGYNVETYNGVVLHFAGGPGNFPIKYEKMLSYFKKNFNN
jgi:hypothetical protein